EVDGDGNTNTAQATELVTVNPLAPTVTWAATTAEPAGAVLTLGPLAGRLMSLSGDSNSLQSLVVSAIPVGATLTDGAGAHTFTATVGSTSVDVTACSLTGTEATATYTLSLHDALPISEVDGDGNTNTAQATELVTVNPLAPTVTWAA